MCINVLDTNHHAVTERRLRDLPIGHAVVGHHHDSGFADCELRAMIAGDPALGEAKRVTQPRHRRANVWVAQLREDRGARHRAILAHCRATPDPLPASGRPMRWVDENRRSTAHCCFEARAEAAPRRKREPTDQRDLEQIDGYRRTGAEPVLMHPVDLAALWSSVKVREAFEKLEGPAEPAVRLLGTLALLIAHVPCRAVKRAASNAQLHVRVVSQVA
jgi:hypothetical protein